MVYWYQRKKIIEILPLKIEKTKSMKKPILSKISRRNKMSKLM